MWDETPVVIDTNVLVSALGSARGASCRLLRELERGSVQAVVSVPLFLGYEEVLGRSVATGTISGRAMELILDYLCAHARPAQVHCLCRPSLRDADDEVVLEAAVASKSRWIVTRNRKDVAGAARFGVQAITPGEFLGQLEFPR